MNCLPKTDSIPNYIIASLLCSNEIWYRIQRAFGVLTNIFRGALRILSSQEDGYNNLL